MLYNGGKEILRHSGIGIVTYYFCLRTLAAVFCTLLIPLHSEVNRIIYLLSDCLHSLGNDDI